MENQLIKISSSSRFGISAILIFSGGVILSLLMWEDLSYLYWLATVISLCGFFMHKGRDFLDYVVPGLTLPTLLIWFAGRLFPNVSSIEFIFGAVTILLPLYFAHKAQSIKVRNRWRLTSFVFVWILGLIIYSVTTSL